MASSRVQYESQATHLKHVKSLVSPMVKFGIQVVKNMCNHWLVQRSNLKTVNIRLDVLFLSFLKDILAEKSVLS